MADAICGIGISVYILIMFYVKTVCVGCFQSVPTSSARLIYESLTAKYVILI